MTESSRVQADALAKSLNAIDRKSADAAMIALARRYAKQLDLVRDSGIEGRILARIGPQYLAVLKELGITPMARKTALSANNGKDPESKPSKLASARQERDELGIKRASKSA